MDIKYSATRSKNFPAYLFAKGIDPFNAIVGVLIQVGQGNKFANSVAFRTCFQTGEPDNAVLCGKAEKDFYPVKWPDINPTHFQLPRPQKARPQGYKYEYVCVFCLYLSSNLLIRNCKCDIALWRQREDEKAHEERMAARKRKREEAEKGADDDDDDNSVDDEQIYTFMDDKAWKSDSDDE